MNNINVAVAQSCRTRQNQNILAVRNISRPDVRLFAARTLRTPFVAKSTDTSRFTGDSKTLAELELHASIVSKMSSIIQ